jgi:hypothetical protein
MQLGTCEGRLKTLLSLPFPITYPPWKQKVITTYLHVLSIGWCPHPSLGHRDQTPKNCLNQITYDFICQAFFLKLREKGVK